MFMPGGRGGQREGCHGGPHKIHDQPLLLISTGCCHGRAAVDVRLRVGHGGPRTSVLSGYAAVDVCFDGSHGGPHTVPDALVVSLVACAVDVEVRISQPRISRMAHSSFHHASVSHLYVEVCLSAATCVHRLVLLRARSSTNNWQIGPPRNAQDAEQVALGCVSALG